MTKKKMTEHFPSMMLLLNIYIYIYIKRFRALLHITLTIRVILVLYFISQSPDRIVVDLSYTVIVALSKFFWKTASYCIGSINEFII